jgi:hypothetical protein
MKGTIVWYILLCPSQFATEPERAVQIVQSAARVEMEAIVSGTEQLSSWKESPFQYSGGTLSTVTVLRFKATLSGELVQSLA